MVYRRTEVDAPRLAGWSLSAVIKMAESRVLGGVVAGELFKSAGIEAFREVVIDEPLPLTPPLPRCGTLPPAGPEAERRYDAPATRAGAPPTIEDYRRAYAEGLTDPLRVAEAALAAIADSEAQSPPLRAFISLNRADLLASAEASKARHAAGEPLSPLDGVPVAVKDEVDVRGLGTTVGTAFLGREPAREDASCVTRLREAGALILGKANMHEIGMGVTGLNLHHGTARNPHDPTRAPGGSSSGSGVAVAAGLCPVAIGADGGGSIRIPSSLCGLVGLKPTHGRVSEAGAAPLCWSVAHLGPMATCARDAAYLYALLAGPDPRDPVSLTQPTPLWPDFDPARLEGARIGIDRAWFADADEPVVRAGLAALEHLVKERGVELVDVRLSDLEHLRVTQLITIAAEMAAAHGRYAAEHSQDYGPDTRLNLCLARGLTATDYVQAQRMRQRLADIFNAALDGLDAIATPTTGCVAPVLSDAALRGGESDLKLLEKVMRFAPPANLTGLPAITTPIGLDPKGLPVGLQLIGAPWSEHRLLELAEGLDALRPLSPPRRSYPVLPAALGGD